MTESKKGKVLAVIETYYGKLEVEEEAIELWFKSGRKKRRRWRVRNGVLMETTEGKRVVYPSEREKLMMMEIMREVMGHDERLMIHPVIESFAEECQEEIAERGKQARKDLERVAEILRGKGAEEEAEKIMMSIREWE